MSLQNPQPFNMNDLTLELELKTCVDGHSHDFTGRKTFSTSFFSKNIGFGITNINIEVNTSLQPIIDITFKDLYGNTLFGTQRGTDNDDIDTSVLFNWPPPKFIFSFKGYLGRKVTWLLNLKTTNVTYVPTDGSYEIKCSFVPNQWGFLADIPVVYLLACKKLREERYMSSQRKSGNCVYTSDSVFSFTRIGKQVQTKTKTETKEFELLSKQLSAIKYGLSNAVFNTKIITPTESISGIVNNIPIPNFINLKVNIPEGNTFDSIKKNLSDSSNNTILSTFLQLNVTKGTNGPADTNVNTKISKLDPKIISNFENFCQDGTIKGIDSGKLEADKSNLKQIVDNNLQLIDNEIKKRVFSSTKKQIGKLTIGEVFMQISRDSAFILGSILDAGFEGFANNQGTRKGSKELIGMNFPLCLNDKGEEVPAMLSSGNKNGSSRDYGVNNYEMKFVDKFIEAIGEGIASNLVSDDIAEDADAKIKNRINNLEALQPNAYKPTYSNIAENVLIRSGIIAYITRSSDPSRPGDYHQTASWDRDSVEKIKELAKKDMDNITDDILTQLSFEDKAQLTRFCTFFNKLLSDNGKDFLMHASSDVNVGFLDSKLSTVSEPKVNQLIWDYPIAMKDIKDPAIKAQLLNNTIPADALKTLGVLTLRQLIFEETLRGNTGTVTSSENQTTFYNTSTIDRETLTAELVKNNGLYYSLPNANSDKYSFIFYDNPIDVEALSSVVVEDKPEDGDADGGGFFSKTLNGSSDEPIGFIPINGATDSEGKTPGRIDILNDAIDHHAGRNVISFHKCKNYYSPTNLYLHEEKIETSSTPGISANKIAYAVYAHTADDSEFTTCVFGPFTKTKRGENQRAAIKVMCKSILDKLDKIEAEKNETLSNVLGKAGEHRDAIYKQMHTIFHQWQIIASSIGGTNFCNGINLAAGAKSNYCELLENEYGDCSNHVENHSVNRTKDGDQLKGGSTLFVYDYPLNPVNGSVVKVKDSIISIEPLYKPNGNTTVLNIIQQICTKNNFVFVPFPGDANSDNIKDIYNVWPKQTKAEIRNYFHVLFTPTPETRSKLSNDDVANTTDYMKPSNIQNDAIEISFGSVFNQIVKNINVSTDSTKPTAESILNLQRLVDKENTSKTVTMDCSMLSVYEGRSYKASVEMIGNAQVYPMQYFYINNMPMFGGLYQILKVSHSITPNNMSTTIEGIRMRFSIETQKYGGVMPVTLEDLQKLGEVSQPMVVTVAGSTGNYVGITNNTPGINTVLEAHNIIPLQITKTVGEYKIGSVFTRNTPNKDGSWAHYADDINFGSGTELVCPFDNAVVKYVNLDSSLNTNSYGGQLLIRTDLVIDGKSHVVTLFFAHMKQILVTKGQILHKGYAIGLSGGGKGDNYRGYTFGPHLHLEMTIDKKRVEPLFHVSFDGCYPNQYAAQTLLDMKNGVKPYTPNNPKSYAKYI